MTGIIETINPGVAATVFGAAALFLFAGAAGPVYAGRRYEQQREWERLATRQDGRRTVPEPDLAPAELVVPEAHRATAAAPTIPTQTGAPAAPQVAGIWIGRDGSVGQSSIIRSGPASGRELAGASTGAGASPMMENQARTRVAPQP